MEHETLRSQIRHLYWLSYFVTVLLCAPYLRSAHDSEPSTALYLGLLLLTYPALYLLPFFMLTRGALAVLGKKLKSPAHRALIATVAVVASTTTYAFVILDTGVFDLYGFHLNGFVLNLVTTRGGLESLGMSGSAVATAVLGVLVLLAFQWGVFLLAGRLARRPVRFPRLYRHALVLVCCLSVVERFAFGAADVARNGQVLAAAQSFPLYNGSTFKGLAERFGFEQRGRGMSSLMDASLRLDYPRAPLEITPPERQPNIVWLVSESWRADALDPQIMPRTWSFAEGAQRFTNHYSGGNGTRMGVFSMFYGLYAPYWFPILDAERSPVLIDALQQQGYQTRMFTSAHFTYPEFDRTVFSAIPPVDLVEQGAGKGWERDRKNVEQLLKFVDGCDPARPFMTFLFFESPHARYYFPEESVIREPYLEDFNYATMNLERDIELIRNRYLNSCHHLDGQFGRIFDHLAAQGLLENTIVVVTGDHGEEFMEKGHWGHGSSFAEEQVRVPLVLWVPGREPAQIDHMTSHVDLPATILPLVGVRNPAEELSLGHDLFGSQGGAFSVIGDWARICFVDQQYKASFPVKTTGNLWNESSRRDDGELPPGVDVMSERPGAMAELLRGLASFRR